MFEDIYFSRKKVNHEKLKRYGFTLKNSFYVFYVQILNGQFRLEVNVSDMGKVISYVYDNETDEEYTLYKIEAAYGSYVGEVRLAVESVLMDISEKCYDADVFKCKQTHCIIDYVHKKYGDEPEYLWPKFPDNAVWRRKDNQKWYGAILTVSRRKLGFDSDEIVEIIDLKMEKNESIADGVKYFPGWHMNKKSWYTIILDGSVDIEEIYYRIDNSYLLAYGKKCI